MKVLFVSVAGSMHAAKWVIAAEQAGVDASFFQGYLSPSEISPALAGFQGALFTPYPFRGPRLAQKSLYRNFESLQTALISDPSGREYAEYLVKVIESVKPDRVHVLGLCINYKNMTEILMLARGIVGAEKFPPICYSSWGADLEFFPVAYPQHLPAIRDFVSIAESYVSECERDLRLVKALGFRGTFLGYFPANGGLDLAAYTDLLRQVPTKSRMKITIKGRDQLDGDPIGRAANIIAALTLAANDVRTYDIHIVQCGAVHVKKMALDLATRFGLKITIEPFLPERKLFELLSESCLFIAMTANDGLPLSLVEAMAMGAYPIHSDLESIRDYIQNGENGSLVPYEDIAGIASEISKVLKHPDLLVKARDLNRDLFSAKLSRRAIIPRMSEIYGPLPLRTSWRKRFRNYMSFFNGNPLK